MTSSELINCWQIDCVIQVEKCSIKRLLDAGFTIEEEAVKAIARFIGQKREELHAFCQERNFEYPRYSEPDAYDDLVTRILNREAAAQVAAAASIPATGGAEDISDLDLNESNDYGMSEMFPGLEDDDNTNDFGDADAMFDDGPMAFDVSTSTHDNNDVANSAPALDNYGQPAITVPPTSDLDMVAEYLSGDQKEEVDINAITFESMMEEAENNN